MRLQKYENREIRSFRLRNNIITLNKFFEEKEKLAWFMMTDSIQPENRIFLREIFSQHGLDLTFLSKKTILLWMQNAKGSNIESLLLGNVVKVSPKKNYESSNFNINTLDYIMSQENLSLRFMYYNKQIYRKSKVAEYLSVSKIGGDSKNLLIEKTLTNDLTFGTLIENLIEEKFHY